MIIEFENCYGIRRMDANFDFTTKSTQLIYAPNGAMKSSFAKTFHDHSMSRNSCDRIHRDRITKRTIMDHERNQISPESIFVVEPYEVEYQSARVSSLLVNDKLKKEYDRILRSIDQKQTLLVKKLKRSAGVYKNLEDIISRTFTRQSNNLLRALDRVRTEVLDDPLDSSLNGIKYSTIFNPKVESFLVDPATKDALAEYTQTYDQLLDKSRFFTQGCV